MVSGFVVLLLRVCRVSLLLWELSQLTLPHPPSLSSSAAPAPSSLTTLQPPPPQQTWLSKMIKQFPAAKQAFLTLAGLLGYGSAKQYAGGGRTTCTPNSASPARTTRPTYGKRCHFPPTYQSWFTVTNIHAWLLIIRLRALPGPHGICYVQGLIDHSFFEVEDRVRANLAPYTRASTFYCIANADKHAAAKGLARPRGRAPESLVSKQMKIFKEQWAGMGMSFDLGPVRSDAELAAAVWRNLLGARGAGGIMHHSAGAGATPAFRRMVNLTAREVEKLARLKKRGGLEAGERRDDGSGVHVHPPAEADKYITYPEAMATRLERVPDEVL
ncbi:hypothetical protein BV20DRAFT_1069701 [Pilatotrama ljubarskyi]|nr:hypothetical protein BV20DRAFT_1069701 [Pilatotrama ljubarskyi]